MEKARGGRQARLDLFSFGTDCHRSDGCGFACRIIGSITAEFSLLRYRAAQGNGSRLRNGKFQRGQPRFGRILVAAAGASFRHLAELRSEARRQTMVEWEPRAKRGTRRCREKLPSSVRESRDWGRPGRCIGTPTASIFDCSKCRPGSAATPLRPTCRKTMASAGYRWRNQRGTN